MNKQFHLAIKNTEGVVEFEKTFDNWPERRAPAPIQENRQPVRTTWGVGFRAFTADFFGNLVPGIAFILCAIPTVVIPFLALAPAPAATSAAAGAPGLSSMFDVGGLNTPAFLLLLLVSYVVGQIFFRQDPKLPDQWSFRTIRRRLKRKNDDASNKLPIPVKLDTPAKDVEFPYLHLREFLKQRGLDHLARHVRWKGNNKKLHRLRSKHVINALKVRIEFLFPELYGRVAGNEAHVRLMSSMWYVSFALIWLSCLGIGLSAFDGTGFSVWKLLGPPLLILFAAVAAMWAIQRVLLYQRVREVVFVLETAHWSDVVFPQYRIFQGLETGDDVAPLPELFGRRPGPEE